ncbi:putative odorant receptor 92a [Battus philenor]|uniref:putative odorant receptor 92a n=1 Tax=Battus philenor TaxID=42288 RepID=UPI0035CEE975
MNRKLTFIESDKKPFKEPNVAHEPQVGHLWARIKTIMPSEKLSFDESLKFITTLFRFGGLSLLGNKSRSTMETVKVRLMYLFNFSCLNCDVIGETWWLIQSLGEGENFLAITFSAPCIAISMMANIKSLLLIFNEERVEELIECIRSIEITEKRTERVKEKEEIMETEKYFLRRVLVPLAILTAIVIFTFSINPCIFMLAHYLKTNEVNLLLPFTIIYPFDPFNIMYYPAVYIHQIWSVCVVNLSTCCVDYLLFTCCVYIKIHFRLIKYDVENIIPKQGNVSNTVTDGSFKSTFREVVERHQMCIRAADLIEQTYSKSILYNFMTSSLLICLTGFNVVAVKDIPIIVTFLLFLIMNLLQIFFLCFFGDLMMRSSADIANGVYNSRWYAADPTVGKSLLILLTRAQKPCKLTALGFAEVNLMAFTRILSTSWSYFCLLNTFYTQ